MMRSFENEVQIKIIDEIQTHIQIGDFKGIHLNFLSGNNLTRSLTAPTEESIPKPKGLR